MGIEQELSDAFRRHDEADDALRAEIAEHTARIAQILADLREANEEVARQQADNAALAQTNLELLELQSGLRDSIRILEDRIRELESGGTTDSPDAPTSVPEILADRLAMVMGPAPLQTE